MPRKGENIRKRKDGRWEARYEKSRDPNGWQTVQTIGSFHDYVIALYDYVMAAVPCYLKGG